MENHNRCLSPWCADQWFGRFLHEYPSMIWLKFIVLNSICKQDTVQDLMTWDWPLQANPVEQPSFATSTWYPRYSHHGHHASFSSKWSWFAHGTVARDTGLLQTWQQVNLGLGGSTKLKSMECSWTNSCRCCPLHSFLLWLCSSNPVKRINSGYKAWEFEIYIYGLGLTLFRHILSAKY